jgi:hypothetical protein
MKSFFVSIGNFFRNGWRNIVPLTTLVVKKARAYEDKRDSVSSLARYN